MRGRSLAMVSAYAAGLLAVGWLRTQTDSQGLLGVLAQRATLIYIALAVAAAVRFPREGIRLKGLGFGGPHFPLRYLGLAVLGLALIQIEGLLLEPVWERIFGSGRDLSRFASVGGSLPELFTLLALSWSLAAFGEELAFRILLMRGLAYAFGNTQAAHLVAIAAQAIIFGLVHAYQGPAGIIGAGISALVYGALTFAARGSIWPAALCHGLSNTIGLVALYLAG